MLAKRLARLEAKRLAPGVARVVDLIGLAPDLVARVMQAKADGTFARSPCDADLQALVAWPMNRGRHDPQKRTQYGWHIRHRQRRQAPRRAPQGDTGSFRASGRWSHSADPPSHYNGAGRHTTALRLCLERIDPPRRDAPVTFALPPMTTAADAAKGAAAVLAAVAIGDLTPTEGAHVMGLIETYRRTLETCDLEARVVALETGAA